MTRFLVIMGITLAAGTLSGWGLFYGTLLYVEYREAMSEVGR